MSSAFRSILPAACILIIGGCPSDDTGDTGAATADTHDHDHGAGTASTAGTAGTTHEHGADSGTAGTTADTHDHSIDTAADDPAVIYCACVFASCHEGYHMKWGEDEMMAEAACLMEADALPMNGSDIDMGNFIECRQHYCDMAAADPTLCTNALGDAVCI